MAPTLTRRPRDRADVRQRTSLAALVNEEPEQLLRGKPSIVRVREHRRHRRFERSGIGNRIQIHDSSAGARTLGLFKNAEAAGIGERDRQRWRRRTSGSARDQRRSNLAARPLVR